MNSPFKNSSNHILLKERGQEKRKTDLLQIQRYLKEKSTAVDLSRSPQNIAKNQSKIYRESSSKDFEHCIAIGSMAIEPIDNHSHAWTTFLVTYEPPLPPPTPVSTPPRPTFNILN
ncbi:hypothetical protein CDAR_287171 [Caerostris darwini]|uniref:Uncharacterized protein n=1 Tax=Caerostris darwini TaxID=1538125 RepID=A0AAV4VB15_9ARAC|nr:hypothetical protein CDAR_287171 [Caerostris darwini]